MTDVVDHELQALYEAHHRLTARMVVDAAEPESHPLHAHFEWDDERAGDQYRLGQAQNLIRSVKRVYRESDTVQHTIREFYSVPTPEEDSGREYRSADDVAENPFTRALVLREMKRDWERMKRKYLSFEEFVELVVKDLAG